MGLFGFKSCQIIGIFVRLECGRRRFDVSCLGIVGLHMGGHELFIVRSFEKLMLQGDDVTRARFVCSANIKFPLRCFDNVVGWHGKRKSSFVPRVRAAGRYSSRCASLAFQASHPIVDGYL